MEIIWFLLSTCLFIGELLLPNLVLLWFGIGALCSVVIAIIGLPILVQIGVFILVSLTLLTKYTKKMVNTKQDKYNSIMEVKEGAVGKVKSEIPVNGVGIVSIGGQDWSARAINDVAISKGKDIEVVEKGVILKVKELKIDKRG